MIEICGIRSLPFSVGMYLPFSVTATIMAGALIAHFAGINYSAEPAEKEEAQPQTLFSSGLIAGGAVSAIGVAIIDGTGYADRFDLGSHFNTTFVNSPAWALLCFAALCYLIWKACRKPGTHTPA
jgi:hypothetical protein